MTVFGKIVSYRDRFDIAMRIEAENTCNFVSKQYDNNKRVLYVYRFDKRIITFTIKYLFDYIFY